MKKTLILGATPNPERYAYLAAQRLTKAGHEIVLVGKKKGEIDRLPIEKGTPQYEGINTVTLYVNPDNQVPYYDYILSLKPKRIIFNPGTENWDLVKLAKAQGIETEIACTLVMLSVENY